VNTYVKNDWSDMICANTHRHTGKNDYVLTDGETHRKLVKNRVTELGESDCTSVQKDSTLKVDGRHSVLSGQRTQIKSDGYILLEAASGIRLLCGGSQLTLTPKEIFIDSKDIWLNCGNQPDDPVWGAPEILQVESPKGADKGTSPNGGEMAKPMPPKNGEPATASRSEASKVNQRILADESGNIGQLENPTPLKYGREELRKDLRNMSKKNNEELQNEFYSDLGKSTIYDGNGKPVQVQEHGGGIVKNSDGTLGYVRVPPGPVTNIQDIPEGGAIGMDFPDDPPENAIATFHTHPWAGTQMRLENDNPIVELQSGPSIEDLEFSEKRKFPGIVLSSGRDGKADTPKIYDNTSPGYL
jgi:hypothetical protein